MHSSVFCAGLSSSLNFHFAIKAHANINGTKQQQGEYRDYDSELDRSDALLAAFAATDELPCRLPRPCGP